MKYVIEGYFNTRDTYCDVAHNEKEFRSIMRSISLNFAARFPYVIRDGKGNVLMQNERLYKLNCPKWLIKWWSSFAE